MRMIHRFAQLLFIFGWFSFAIHAQVLKVVPNGFVLVADSVSGKQLSPDVFDLYDGAPYAVEEEGIEWFRSNQNRYLKPYIQDGCICLRKNKLWGCLNVNGKKILDFKYESRIDVFNNGKYFGYHTNGEPAWGIRDFRNDYDNTFHLLDKNGKEIAQYTRLNARYGAPYIVQGLEPGLKGVLSADFDTLAGFDYECTSWDSKNFFFTDNGYLALKNREGKCGVINTKGEIVMPFEYDFIEDPHFALNLVVKDSLSKGLMNEKLEWVLPPEYEEIRAKGYNGMSYMVHKNGLWTVLDTLLKPWCENRFQEIGSNDSYVDDNVIVKENGKYGVFDFKEKKYLVEPGYEAVISIDRVNDGSGLYLVKKSGRYGVYKPASKKYTVMPDYDTIMVIKTDQGKRFFAKKKDVYYQYDLNGKYYTLKASEAYPVINSKKLVAKMGEKWYVTDSTGKKLSAGYDFIYLPLDEKISDLFLVINGAKHGFINGSGKVVVPVVYEDGYIPYSETYDENAVLSVIQQGKMLHFDNAGKLMGENKIDVYGRRPCGY